MGQELKSTRRAKAKRAYLLSTPFDRAQSRIFVHLLRRTGFRFPFGASRQAQISRLDSLLSQIDLILIMWSGAALQSSRFARDLNFALLRADSVKSVRVITLALDATPIPSKLYQFEVINFEGPNPRRHAYEELSNLLENRHLPVLSAAGRFIEIGGLSTARRAKGKASRAKVVRAARKLGIAKGKEAKQLAANLRSTQIDRLAHSLRAGGLSLFCGSGVSADAGMPNWNDLLGRLVFQMMKKLAPRSVGKWNAKQARQYFELAIGSPLIVAKQMKVQLGDQFSELVRDALYSDKAVNGPIIREIVELARPQRNSSSVDSIVTFNFDGLIEESLQKEHIAHRTIHSEAVNPDSDELPIYHVHGFLPRRGEIPKDMMLVFSEDGYHNQFLDPFSWANLIQLQKLTQNVCLLVGISLTDPNMRRLVDVAWRKGQDATRHFIIWKAPESKNALVRHVTKQITEQDANALGLDVIWIEKFSEIPKLLVEIRKAAFPPSPPAVPKVAAKKTAKKAVKKK